MFTSMRSRRMPALLTSTSSRPKVAIACSIMRAAPAKSLTSSPLAIASPPAAAISATTSCAGPDDAPLPSRAPPRSFTTTLAPCAANISAYSRPMPRPAPVMITTRPSQSFAMLSSPMGAEF
jgi:hypothetical protein